MQSVLWCCVLGALLLTCALISHKRQLTRCQIAQALQDNNVRISDINDWVCLVESESQGNTALERPNPDGSKSYGLFAISSATGCDEKKKGNLCSIQCKSLKNSNLSDDVKCAKKIQKASGFEAWPGWVRSCKGGKAPNVASCL